MHKKNVKKRKAKEEQDAIDYHDSAKSIFHVRFASHVVLEQLRHILYLGVRGEILGVVR